MTVFEEQLPYIPPFDKLEINLDSCLRFEHIANVVRNLLGFKTEVPNASSISMEKSLDVLGRILTPLISDLAAARRFFQPFYNELQLIDCPN